MDSLFVDEVKLFLKAGKGGDGLIISRRLPSGRFLNNGGGGGRGGDIYIQADESLYGLGHLLRQKKILAAEGGEGKRNNKTGSCGKNTIIKVPLGTQVRTKEGRLLADLTQAGQKFLAARGGLGGLGNFRKKANESLRQKSKGQAGEEKEIILDWRLMAEIALVGFTNTGKSTFLADFTSLRAKVSPFPFTTTQPLLGMAKFGFRNVGIIELPAIGDVRYKDKGGRSFLKHLERVSLIILWQDTSCGQSENFFLLKKLISSYNSKYLEKKILKVVNKIEQGARGDKEAIGVSLHKNIGRKTLEKSIEESLDETHSY